MVEYIAVTNKHNWGRGESITEALDNACQYKDSGKCEVLLYKIDDVLWERWEISHLDGSVSVWATDTIEDLGEKYQRAMWSSCVTRWHAKGHTLSPVPLDLEYAA